MAFPILGLFLLFIFITAYFRHKGTAMQKEAEDLFWEREHKANLVRRKSLDDLPYISIPYDKFPIGISDDDELIGFEKQLLALATAKIVNFKNQSNTDLKLQYGPANLPALSEYDDNFAKLASIIVPYSKRLILLGHEMEAIPVLEFGIECGSDVSSNYTTLAKIYKKNNENQKLDVLIESANQLESIMKQPILDKLSAIRES